MSYSGARMTLPMFMSDVNARHDKMVELETRMMELKKQVEFRGRDRWLLTRPEVRARHPIR